MLVASMGEALMYPPRSTDHRWWSCEALSVPIVVSNGLLPWRSEPLPQELQSTRHEVPTRAITAIRANIRTLRDNDMHGLSVGRRPATAGPWVELASAEALPDVESRLAPTTQHT